MKGTLIILILVFSLLALPAAAYTGDSFSIDIPEGYRAVSGGETRQWARQDGSSLVITVVEGSGYPNPYDWTEEDAGEFANELRAQLQSQLEDQLGASGVTVEVESAYHALGDLGACRCVTADYIARFTGELELTQYQRDVLITTMDRSYLLAYTAVGADSLPDEAVSILESFTTTDRLYAGKTGFFASVPEALSGSLLIDIIKWGAIGGVIGLGWWYIDRRKKRRSSESAPPEESLPDFK